MIQDFFDKGLIESHSKSTDGSIKIRARLTSVGIYTYSDSAGTRRDYRPKEEVFSPTTLKSIKTSPVTNDHPFTDGIPTMVNSKNFKEFAVGYPISEASHDERYVFADLVVYDEKAIEAVEQGKVQISLGYRAEREPSSGEWNGEVYDSIQRNISVNHIALVYEGRAGPEVKILQYIDKKDERMKYFFDEKEWDLPKEFVEAFDHKVKKTNSELEKASYESKRLQEEVEKLKGAIEILDSKRVSDDQVLERAKSLSREFSSISKTAECYLDSSDIEPFFDSFDTTGLKKLVIKKVHPAIDLSGKCEQRIEGMWETITASDKKPKDEGYSRGIGREIIDSRGQTSADEILKKVKESQSSAWKKPINS
jgi:uncharacterized protein